MSFDRRKGLVNGQIMSFEEPARFNFRRELGPLVGEGDGLPSRGKIGLLQRGLGDLLPILLHSQLGN